MVRNGRTVIVFLALTLSFVAVGMKLFFLQVWHHDELSKQVSKLTYRNKPEIPCRGMILDKNGKMLAMSVKSYSVFADPTRVDKVSATRQALKKYNIILPENIKALASKTSFVPLKDNLEPDIMREIKALELPGIGFTPGFTRNYPEGKMACHVLGVVGRDGRGMEGIELACNGLLTGQRVKTTRYRDGRGREVSERLVDSDNFKGADVYLTIDKNLQFIAEQEIEKAWMGSRAQKAVVIIQDPNNGEILALAARPAFDPSDYSSMIKYLKNPAVCDTLEPGSTFKLITAAAALEEKLVTTKENIWCEDGKYLVYDHTIRDHEKQGFLNLEGIMEYSSNIGMAKIGQRLGKEKFYDYIRQFGFGSLTGIDLPGEARGILRSPETWSGLSVPVIAFGQEIGTTAIQVINAYSSVVNGGYLLEPKIVREIRNSAGTTVFSSEKRVIRKTISAETCDLLKKMLVSVVDNGTGQLAKVTGYSVGGKTGTAQKRDTATRKYSSSKYVASFCGAIPMSDPKLTILVLLDEPQGDYWASSRTAPVFGRIASRAVKYLQISPDKDPVNLCDLKTYSKKTGVR